MSLFNLKRQLAVMALLLSSLLSFAQNKASVKGRVIDSVSSLPIEFATVAIVNAKDTSLISYTITQNDGAFTLTGLPVGVETRLIISTMGYSTFRKTLVFKPGEFKNTGPLLLVNKMLTEVLIKGERSPIVQKKDTLEFNTEAFKTRPNAVVEDLLRLLPGVQVNVDGSILVNGTQVKKLLVDGKRFFGSDPTVATRNLDADMVSTIQVYDDRDEDPDHKLSPLEVGKIINLKMKSKIKKSTLGKVFAGGGTRGRYEAGGVVSNFRDTLQISLIGLTNNLTRTGFSTGDLYSMGGFNRSGGSQQNDGTFGGSGDGGIERMRSIGFNINNNYGKAVKTNLMYFYTNYIKDYAKKLLTEQTLDQTLLTTLNTSTSQIRQQKHSIGGLIEWTSDDAQNLRIDLKLDISPSGFGANAVTNTFNTQTPKLTDLLTNTSTKGLTKEFTDNLIYYRKLKKPGASLTIGQSFNLKTAGSDDYNYNDLLSFTSAINPSLLDRYTNSGSSYYLAGLTASLNTPLNSKTSNDLFVQSRYLYSANRLSTFDKDATGNYDIFLDNQSNNLIRTNFIQNVQDVISYKVANYTTLKTGLNLETHNITNNFNGASPTSNRWYKFVFPVVQLNGIRYRISYDESVEQPDINQMQPITRQISPVETLTGNPDLTPSHKRNLNFGYNRYFIDKQSSIRINANVSLTDNNVIRVSTQDANGFITTNYTNKDGGWQSNFGVFRGKQFKKSQLWQVSIMNGLNGHFDQRSFLFNGNQGIQYNYSFTAGQNVTASYKSAVTFDATYLFTGSMTNYGGVSYSPVHTLQHRLVSMTTVYWPKNFIFDAQYQYLYNPQIAPGFSRSSNVVNLALTMLMFKQNTGQVKLSVYDLFDQNTNVYRYAANNSVTSGEQQILKRYFFITYQYKFHSYKSK